MFLISSCSGGGTRGLIYSVTILEGQRAPTDPPESSLSRGGFLNISAPQPSILRSPFEHEKQHA